ESAFGAADAGGVADERDAAVGVVIADVMRRMARRIRHVEIPGASGESLAAAKDREGVLGHRPEFAPEPIHLVAPEAGRAGDEPRQAQEVEIDIRQTGGEWNHFRRQRAMSATMITRTSARRPVRPIQRSSVSQLLASA